MAEYIDRETLLNSICNKHCDCDYDGECPNCRLTEPIVAAPAADVAPVQHGRWIEKTAPAVHKYYECSNCGAHENKHTAIKGRYCWRCGAKMDGAE